MSRGQETICENERSIEVGCMLDYPYSTQLNHPLFYFNLLVHQKNLELHFPGSSFLDVPAESDKKGKAEKKEKAVFSRGS